MKAIITLLMITISGTIYSQDYATLKKSDTVYILFKSDNSKCVKLNYNAKSYTYLFAFGESSNFVSDLIFYHNHKVPETRTEKKSFLKKNKDLILTYDFIKRFSLEKSKELFANKNKIYIIDHNDNGWFTIKLNEVKISNFNPIPIE